MENIAGLINLVFTLGLAWTGVKYIFEKLRIGELSIIKRIAPNIVYIDANGLPELTDYLNRVDQRMLYIAWSLKDSRLVPKQKRKDCVNVCKAAQDLINAKHVDPTSDLSLRHYLQQYK